MNLIEYAESNNALFVVEGKHDYNLLILLNIPPRKIYRYSSRGLHELIDTIEKNKINSIILMIDRDKGGQKIEKQLREIIRELNIKIIDFWKILLDNLKPYGFKTVRKIEELKKLVLTSKKPNDILIKTLKIETLKRKNHLKLL